MNPFVLALLAAAGGGFLTSLIEYKLNYNLIDTLLDFVRSAEAKVARLKLIADAANKRVLSAALAIKKAL